MIINYLLLYQKRNEHSPIHNDEWCRRVPCCTVASCRFHTRALCAIWWQHQAWRTACGRFLCTTSPSVKSPFDEHRTVKIYHSAFVNTLKHSKSNTLVTICFVPRVIADFRFKLLTPLWLIMSIEKWSLELLFELKSKLLLALF